MSTDDYDNDSEGMNCAVVAIPASEYSKELYAIVRCGVIAGRLFENKEDALIVKAWLDSVRYDFDADGNPDMY